MLENGSWTNNQEMLIVLLTRCASPSSWITIEREIGVEYSRISRIFKVIILLYYLLFILLLHS